MCLVGSAKFIVPPFASGEEALRQQGKGLILFAGPFSARGTGAILACPKAAG